MKSTNLNLRYSLTGSHCDGVLTKEGQVLIALEELPAQYNCSLLRAKNTSFNVCSAVFAVFYDTCYKKVECPVWASVVF